MYEINLSPGKAMSDFDGDGKTDALVFRFATDVWYLLQSGAGFRAEHFRANQYRSRNDGNDAGPDDLACSGRCWL